MVDVAVMYTGCVAGGFTVDVDVVITGVVAM